MFPRCLPLLALVLGLSNVARAEIALPHIFTDHLVLQRGVIVPVWGQAQPGEHVVVHFAGQERRAVADEHGAWRVTLAPLAVSAEPRDLECVGTNRVVLHDVLVGEVWLCSGQSNMEMAIGLKTAGAEPEAAHDATLAEQIKTAVFPLIRLFRVEKQRGQPDVVTNGWQPCQGDALARFSAAGFFFGQELQQRLRMPIGLVESAWGGSRIEEWTSDSAYQRLEGILGSDAGRCFERDDKIVSRNYDAMIAPLAPYALRGVIWYQGESNLIVYHDGRRYADKFAVLVANWRSAWSRPDLPFYAVQLAPYAYTQRKDDLPHAGDELPKLWEAQQLATAVPHTGLVPITDTVSDVHNIHPGRKSIVGRRLAAQALANTYGTADITAAGPTFAGLVATTSALGGRVLENERVVLFDHADEGLTTSDGRPPTEFEVAGTDGRFVPATATIWGDRVAVSSPEVPHPVTVRFGWHETAQPNLRNKAGWPAYPFRSDAPVWRAPAP